MVDLDVLRLKYFLFLQKSIDKSNKLWYNICVIKRKESTVMLMKVRRASNEPKNIVVKTVEINTIEDLISLEKEEEHPIILVRHWYDDDEECSLLVYDDYIE